MKLYKSTSQLMVFVRIIFNIGIIIEVFTLKIFTHAASVNAQQCLR